MLDTILLNVYGIRLGLDVGTELDFLDGSFDGSNGNQVCAIIARRYSGIH